VKRRKKSKAPLAPGCTHCRPYRGLWRNYGTLEKPRLERCDCERGRELARREGRTKRFIPPDRPELSLFDGRMAAAGKDSE